MRNQFCIFKNIKNKTKKKTKKKTLNDWSLGKQLILFPENLNVSLASGNIEIRGKQN